MRVSFLSTVVVVNAFGAVALESLSDFVKDFPQCSLSAFKKALDKEGCDTTSVGTPTFDCLCKHLTSIVVTMSTSGIDANCNANWSSALTGVCANYGLYSTTATDFPEATKALAAELGAAGANTGPSSTGSAPATKSTAGAASASSSKGLAAASTPVLGILGAAALAGVLV